MFKSAFQQLESVSTPPIVQKSPDRKAQTNSDYSSPIPNRPDLPENKIPSTKPTGTGPLPVASDSELNAKWMRLSELLTLTPEQVKAIEAVINENQPDKTGETTVKDAFRVAGEKLEAALLASLTSEQQTAFKDLQKRTLQNQSNAKAMRQYADELAALDLTPEQRLETITILAQEIEKQSSAIPNSTRLLLSGSFLPIPNTTISQDGILLLNTIDENTGFEEIAETRRAEMEQKMKQFEGILTPAQLQIYQENVKKSLEHLNQIPAN